MPGSITAGSKPRPRRAETAAESGGAVSARAAGRSIRTGRVSGWPRRRRHAAPRFTRSRPSLEFAPAASRWRSQPHRERCAPTRSWLRRRRRWQTCARCAVISKPLDQYAVLTEPLPAAVRRQWAGRARRSATPRRRRTCFGGSVRIESFFPAPINRQVPDRAREKAIDAANRSADVRAFGALSGHLRASGASGRGTYSLRHGRFVCRLSDCTEIFPGICLPWARLAMAPALRGWRRASFCGNTRESRPKGTTSSASRAFFRFDVTRDRLPAVKDSRRVFHRPLRRRMIPRRGHQGYAASRRDPTESGRERVRHGEHVIEHLLRRAGFGASDDEIDDYLELGFSGTVQRLLHLRERARRCRCADWASPATSRSPRAASSCRGTVINDSRQRWLFRMIHSRRPLQEKMTLFWHNHFATAYTKIAGALRRRRGRAVHGREAGRGSRIRSRDRSSSSGSSRSATSAICWSPSRRTRRCSCGSTAARTSRAGRRRTSHAS